MTPQTAPQNPEALWQAVCTRDSTLDGTFFYAVITTGVYCRPSCRARQPRPENIRFYATRTLAESAGFRPCKRCRPETDHNVDIQTVEAICRYLEANLDPAPTLAALGRQFHLSPFHLQRKFKAQIGISPRAYAEACRLRNLKSGLRQGHSVTHAMYHAGYSSSSRLYERTDSQLGMTPAAYRKGGQDTTIRYSVADSPFGKMLIATTEKGVCSIQLDDNPEALRDKLRREFYAATLIEEPPSAFTGRPLDQLPLDIQATAFQRRVWEHLQSIPAGTTQSYSKVAEAIGKPSATRAVARACANNPVALAIPCHRVVRSDGTLGGYRWGIERKRAILESEQR